MSGLERMLADLRRERDELAERNRQLEEALCGLKDTAEAMRLGLTPLEYRAFLVLRRHGCVSRDGLMQALYAARPGDMPDERGLSVLIFKLRQKLKPHGYALNGQYGTGWRLVQVCGGEPWPI